MRRFKKNPTMTMVFLPGYGRLRGDTVVQGDEYAKYVGSILVEVTDEEPTAAPPVPSVPEAPPAPAAVGEAEPPVAEAPAPVVVQVPPASTKAAISTERPPMPTPAPEIPSPPADEAPVSEQADAQADKPKLTVKKKK